MLDMENNAAEQGKKQRYDYIRGYQFVKGQSGNPSGRPKGAKSLKTFAREYLETLPPEEKLEFLKCLPEELVFRMAEGNPRQDTDITSGGKELPQPIINIVSNENKGTNSKI